MKCASEVMTIVVAALMDGPCSLKDLCVAIGANTDNTERVKKKVEFLKGHGLIYIASYSNRRHPVYAWQPSRHQMPDVLKPNSADGFAHMMAEFRRNQDKTRPRRHVITPMGPNSVFALGAL